jgi:hypothetical protein
MKKLRIFTGRWNGRLLLLYLSTIADLNQHPTMKRLLSPNAFLMPNKSPTHNPTTIATCIPRLELGMKSRVEKTFYGLSLLKMGVHDFADLLWFDPAVPGFVWQDPDRYAHVALSLTRTADDF